MSCPVLSRLVSYSSHPSCVALPSPVLPCVPLSLPTVPIMVASKQLLAIPQKVQSYRWIIYNLQWTYCASVGNVGGRLTGFEPRTSELWGRCFNHYIIIQLPCYLDRNPTPVSHFIVVNLSGWFCLKFLHLTLRAKENWAVREPLTAVMVYVPLSLSRGCRNVRMLWYLTQERIRDFVSDVITILRQHKYSLCLSVCEFFFNLYNINISKKWKILSGCPTAWMRTLVFLYLCN